MKFNKGSQPPVPYYGSLMAELDPGNSALLPDGSGRSITLKPDISGAINQESQIQLDVVGLLSQNVKKGVSFLDTTGTYEGESGGGTGGNAKATDLASGKTATVTNEDGSFSQVTGSINDTRGANVIMGDASRIGYQSSTRGIFIKPRTTIIVEPNTEILAESPNLLPQNVRQGTDINGMIGTLKPYVTTVSTVPNQAIPSTPIGANQSAIIPFMQFGSNTSNQKAYNINFNTGYNTSPTPNIPYSVITRTGSSIGRIQIYARNKDDNTFTGAKLLATIPTGVNTFYILHLSYDIDTGTMLLVLGDISGGNMFFTQNNVWITGSGASSPLDTNKPLELILSVENGGTAITMSGTIRGYLKYAGGALGS